MASKASRILIRKLLILSITTGCASKDENIQDIYYYPGSFYSPEYFAKAQREPYTLNECKEDCVTFVIRRKFYDSYAKQYTDLGLEFPYPRREGMEGVLYP